MSDDAARAALRAIDTELGELHQRVALLETSRSALLQQLGEGRRGSTGATASTGWVSTALHQVGSANCDQQPLSGLAGPVFTCPKCAQSSDRGRIFISGLVSQYGTRSVQGLRPEATTLKGAIVSVLKDAGGPRTSASVTASVKSLSSGYTDASIYESLRQMASDEDWPVVRVARNRYAHLHYANPIRIAAMDEMDAMDANVVAIAATDLAGDAEAAEVN